MFQQKYVYMKNVQNSDPRGTPTGEMRSENITAEIYA